MLTARTSADQGGAMPAILCKPVCNFCHSLRGQGGWANCTCHGQLSVSEIGQGGSDGIWSRFLFSFPAWTKGGGCCRDRRAVTFLCEGGCWDRAGVVRLERCFRWPGRRFVPLGREGRGRGGRRDVLSGSREHSSPPLLARPAASDFPPPCFHGAVRPWGHGGMCPVRFHIPTLRSDLSSPAPYVFTTHSIHRVPRQQPDPELPPAIPARRY